MKWYFVLNETAHASYVEAAKVSALSCIRNTSLQPHILYDGQDNDFTVWLRDNGVTVHLTSVPFVDRLFEQRGVRGLHPEAARGAYLRTMIPTIERDEDFVLYTDSDVVFQHDPTEHLAGYRPRYVAATAEADVDDSSFFNSGVMVMNVRMLRRASRRMFRFIERTLPYWGGFSPNDQGSLNYFFRGAWEPIDPKLNWKPYWGRRDDAWIVHHHGNRVGEVIGRIQSGLGAADRSSTRRRIYSEPASRLSLLRAAQDYIHYLDEVYAERSRIERAMLSGTDLQFDVLPGADVQFAPFLVLELLVDGVRIGTVAPTIDRRKLNKVQTYVVSLAGVAIPAGARIDLVGRDFTWAAAEATRDDRAAIAEAAERIDLTPSEDAGAAPIVAPTPTATVPGATLLRVWTLPGINRQFSGAMIEAPLDFDQMFAWNSKTGALERVELSTFTPQDTAPLVNEIRVDADAGIPERILSAVAQAAGFEALKGEADETYRVERDSELESDVLRRLGFTVDPVRAVVGAPEPRVRHIVGAGTKAAGASVAIDRLVRARTQHRSGFGEESRVLLLDGSEDRLLHDLLKRARARGYTPVKFAADYRMGTVKAVMGASLIVVADDRFAPVLALAAPHAAVVHLALPGSGGVVRHLCSLRNLLYARIDLTALAEGRIAIPDPADALRLLGAIDAAAVTMLEGNVVTSAMIEVEAGKSA